MTYDKKESNSYEKWEYENNSGEDELSESERIKDNSRFKNAFFIWVALMICLYGGLYLIFG